MRGCSLLALSSPFFFSAPLLPSFSLTPRARKYPPPRTPVQRAYEGGLRTQGKQMAFLLEDQYGALLKEYCYSKPKASVSALFALQGFFHKINFPLGDKNVAKLYTIFAQLYEEEIIAEDPMQAWRNDVRNPTPGHSAALVQTEQCVCEWEGGGGFCFLLHECSVLTTLFASLACTTLLCFSLFAQVL